MITVNSKKYPWVEGQTLEDVLNMIMEEERKENYMKGLDVSNIGVFVNDIIVEPSEFKQYLISDGDRITILPIIVGG